jgi:hypothetical protein
VSLDAPRVSTKTAILVRSLRIEDLVLTTFPSQTRALMETNFLPQERRQVPKTAGVKPQRAVGEQSPRPPDPFKWPPSLTLNLDWAATWAID